MTRGVFMKTTKVTSLCNNVMTQWPISHFLLWLLLLCGDFFVKVVFDSFLLFKINDVSWRGPRLPCEPNPCPVPRFGQWWWIGKEQSCSPGCHWFRILCSFSLWSFWTCQVSIKCDNYKFSIYNVIAMLSALLLVVIYPLYKFCTEIIHPEQIIHSDFCPWAGVTLHPSPDSHCLRLPFLKFY